MSLGRSVQIEACTSTWTYEAQPMGIEITAPAAVTIAELNAVLAQHGIAARPTETGPTMGFS